MSHNKQKFLVINSKNSEELENQLNDIAQKERIWIVSNIVLEWNIITVLAVYLK